MFVKKLLLFVISFFVNIPIAYSATFVAPFSDQIDDCLLNRSHSKDLTFSDLSQEEAFLPPLNRFSPHPLIDVLEPLIYKVEQISSTNHQTRFQIREVVLEEQDFITSDEFPWECLLNRSSTFKDLGDFQQRRTTLSPLEIEKLLMPSPYFDNHDREWLELYDNDTTPIVIFMLVPKDRLHGESIQTYTNQLSPHIRGQNWRELENIPIIPSLSPRDYFINSVESFTNPHTSLPPSYNQDHHWRKSESPFIIVSPILSEDRLIHLDGHPFIDSLPFSAQGHIWRELRTRHSARIPSLPRENFVNAAKPVTTPPIPLPFFVLYFQHHSWGKPELRIPPVIIFPLPLEDYLINLSEVSDFTSSSQRSYTQGQNLKGLESHIPPIMLFPLSSKDRFGSWGEGAMASGAQLPLYLHHNGRRLPHIPTIPSRSLKNYFVKKGFVTTSSQLPFYIPGHNHRKAEPLRTPPIILFPLPSKDHFVEPFMTETDVHGIYNTYQSPDIFEVESTFISGQQLLESNLEVTGSVNLDQPWVLVKIRRGARR